MIISLVAVLTSCGGPTEKPTSESIRVRVAEATSATTDSKKEFPFIAEPFRTSELSFRVGGPIEQFDLYVGNHYKRGEVIAQIDPRDFRIRRDRAEAIYNQAKAEFDRIEILYHKDNISASSYERAKADYATAKAAFDTASNELSDTRLIAPFDGYVSEVHIEKYQDVKPTQPVLSFVDVSRLRIEAYVTQEIAFAAQHIREVDLCFDALPGQTLRAKVAEVSKSTTRNNLSYLVTALLPNADGKLLSGMSGRMVFDVEASTVVTIPQTALCHRPGEGDYVWVVDPATDQVTRRSITLGSLMPNGRVSVAEGVASGEIVAVSGLRFLSDGMSVEIHTK